MTWVDAEDNCIVLFEKFSSIDPLTVRLIDLRDKVLQLDDFYDDPNASNEPRLEALQMASYE